MSELWEELAPNVYVIFGEGGLGISEKFSSHSYLFVGEKKVVLVDPGSTEHEGELKTALPELGVAFPGVSRHESELSGQREVNLIIATHEHWDHITAADYFPEAEKAAGAAGIEALNAQDDSIVRHLTRGQTYHSKFTRGLEDGELIDLGNFQLHVLSTPGHTAGSICLYEPTLRILLTGDTFFGSGAISRIFMEGGRALHVKSLERIAELAEESPGLAAIYPGHGHLIEGEANVRENIELSLERAREDLG